MTNSTSSLVHKLVCLQGPEVFESVAFLSYRA
jgi:hypothetical protein